jgi:hypothetical protein
MMNSFLAALAFSPLKEGKISLMIDEPVAAARNVLL